MNGVGKVQFVLSNPSKLIDLRDVIGHFFAVVNHIVNRLLHVLVLALRLVYKVVGLVQHLLRLLRRPLVVVVHAVLRLVLCVEAA